MLDAAREALAGDAGRPVARFHTETALKQLAGLIELVDELSPPGRRARRPTPPSPRPPRLRAAGRRRAPCRRSRPTSATWSCPRSKGEGRLGPELFAAKMRHTMRLGGADAGADPRRAEREFDAVRGEMIRLAREVWPRWLGGEPSPDEDRALVRAVLDEIAGEHPAADGLLDFCRAELRIESFCRERNVIGLADEPLDIRWTPVFLRAFGGAMLDAPGPLDRGQKASSRSRRSPTSGRPRKPSRTCAR